MRITMLRLALVQLAGNAVLLALGYYWLGLPESTAGALAWSALVALAILAGACVLHGAAFLYCARPEPGLKRAFAAAARRLPILMLWAVLACAFYIFAAHAHDLARAPAFHAASFLTMTLRRPVRPAAVLQGVDVVVGILRWVVVPVLALPLFAGVAVPGRRGWRYWVLTPVLLFCALWVPFLILGWTPRSTSFGVEMASFLARAALAYGLFIAAWLAIVFLTARGIPRFTQSRTAVSP